MLKLKSRFVFSLCAIFLLQCVSTWAAPFQENLDIGFCSIVENIVLGNPILSQAEEIRQKGTPLKNVFNPINPNIMNRQQYASGNVQIEDGLKALNSFFNKRNLMVVGATHDGAGAAAAAGDSVVPLVIVTGMGPRHDSREKAVMERILGCQVLDVFDLLMPEQLHAFNKDNMRDILMCCAVLNNNDSKIVFSLAKKLTPQSQNEFVAKFTPSHINRILDAVLAGIPNAAVKNTTILALKARCDECELKNTHLTAADLATGVLNGILNYRNDVLNNLAIGIAKLFHQQLQIYSASFLQIQIDGRILQGQNFVTASQLFFSNVNKALALMKVALDKPTTAIQLIGDICSKSGSPGLGKFATGILKNGDINKGVGLNKPAAALERALHSEPLAFAWARNVEQAIYPFMFTQRDMCPTCNVFLPNALSMQLVEMVHILSVVEANNPDADTAALAAPAPTPATAASHAPNVAEFYHPWYALFLPSESPFSSEYAVDSGNGIIQRQQTNTTFALNYTLLKPQFYKKIIRVRIQQQGEEGAAAAAARTGAGRQGFGVQQPPPPPPGPGVGLGLGQGAGVGAGVGARPGAETEERQGHEAGAGQGDVSRTGKATRPRSPSSPGTGEGKGDEGGEGGVGTRDSGREDEEGDKCRKETETDDAARVAAGALAEAGGNDGGSGAEAEDQTGLGENQEQQGQGEGQ